MRLMSLPVGLPALADSDLVGQIARMLMQAIVQGRLPPGSKVVEAAIARELGVSRAPVREAARLEGSKAFAKEIMASAGVPCGTNAVAVTW